jgi:hypothetical protein
VAHDQQTGWFGADLKELAGAVEERGARGGEELVGCLRVYSAETTSHVIDMVLNYMRYT